LKCAEILIVLSFISRLTVNRSTGELILFDTSDVKHCLVATREKTRLCKNYRRFLI